MPDGVTFVREAVLRPSRGPAPPADRAAWQEGSRTDDRRAAMPTPRAAGTDNAHDRDLTADLRPANALRELARRLGLAGFWRWWIGELAPLVPAAPRAALERRRMRPVLAFDGDVATLWRAVARRRRPLVHARRRRASPLDRRSADASRRGPRRDRRAAPRPAPAPRAKWRSRCRRAQVLRKRLALPAAVEDNLARRSPTTSTATRRSSPTSSISTPRSSTAIRARRRSRVDWAAARRASVDRRAPHAESWGAQRRRRHADAPRRAARGVAAQPAAADDASDARAAVRRWQFWLPLALLRRASRWSRSCCRCGRSANTRSRSMQHRRPGARSARRPSALRSSSSA